MSERPAGTEDANSHVARSIELDRVGVTLNGNEVLREVRCSLSAKRIAVIGPNGSGKSTFARLLNGLVTATEGKIRVFGHDPDREGKRLRREVGFVFSNPAVQLIMPTVREDLAMSLRGRGLSRADIDARVVAAIAASPLAGRGDDPVHSLSGGQQQLLALLGVELIEPRLIIADEPTALLDLVNSRAIAARLLAVDAPQLVLVTHDLDLARRCDLALRFDAGRLVEQGHPDQVVASYLASVSAE